MTVFRDRWRRSAAMAATGAAALVGTGIMAVPASAHTPSWTVDCSSVSVELTRYNAGVANTVTIKAGGKDVLSTEKFGKKFEKTLKLPEHSSPLKVRLIVEAGDGERFSVDETKSSPVCEGEESPEPTPSSTPPSTPPPSESASPTPSETASSEAPAAEPQGNSPAPNDLAETGSSSATPMIAGAAGAVVLAGAGLLIVSRRRRSSQH